MAALYNQVLRPSVFSELFAVWNRYPNAVPFAGGTAMIRGLDREGKHAEDNAFLKRSHELPPLPENILSLERIEELRIITRTEHYLEIGAMVRLGELLALGKAVPAVLAQTLRGIAGPQVRNLATVGGNLCVGGDITAPMTALDARYELRNAGGTRWIPALRFGTFQDSLSKQELLTRIRIPLADWNYTVYRKFPADEPGGEGGVLILAAQTRKDFHIQVVFAGAALLRDKNSETFLEGKTLPLDRRDALHYVRLWSNYLSGMGKAPLLASKIVNAIGEGILGLSD